MKLTNIILPTSPSNNTSAPTHDIEISNHTIKTITPHSHPTTSPSIPCPPPSLLLPTLCHPHIHLDKPYLLTSNYNHPSAYPSCCPPPPTSHQTSLPDYSSLAPQCGSFPEALSLTSKSKELYTSADLYLRGKQLLATSYTQGVTSARCFVEVDNVTQFKAIEAGLSLKREFQSLVRVQICAFAQDPVFSSPHNSENRMLMEEVLSKYDEVECLGSTPYVESDREESVRNIEWAIQLALKYGLHLDFHLDYHLDETKELMVWEVIRLLKEYKWPTDGGKTVVLGHCSALTLLPHSSLRALAEGIKEAGLPMYFVGLPSSDLYMMGRPPSSSEAAGDQKQTPLNRPRGTLNVPSLITDYGLEGCIGVNNMGNAFTPYGTGDPLELAGWGVGLYQAGGEGMAERLFECVSSGARRAIGLEVEVEDDDKEKGWGVKEGIDIGEFGLLIVRNEEFIGGDEVLGEMKVPARRRVGVRDVVWDVPEVRLRRVVR